MTQLEQLAQRYAEVYATSDRAELDALLEQVPASQLHEFFSLLERMLQPTGEPYDRVSLQRALARAGVDDAEAARAAALASGDVSQFLQRALDDAALDLDELSRAVTASLDTLGSSDVPRVRRYVERLVDGRHDLRRVGDTALEALALALGTASGTLAALRDTARAASSGGTQLAAARGAGDQAVALSGDDAPRDAVDRLFDTDR